LALELGWVRAAFGAGRWALVRRSIAESGVLTVAGGAERFVSTFAI